MELTPGQIALLKRATGKEEITINDYFELVMSLSYGLDDDYEGITLPGEKTLNLDPTHQISEISKMRLFNYARHKLQGVDHHHHKHNTDYTTSGCDAIEEEEHILCSAIYFDDDKQHVHAPTNVLSGFVICGRRHHNCFAQIASLGVDRKQILQYKQTQGFLTNQDRFLDRGEALIVAYKAKQTDKCIGELFSEDLW